LNRNDYRRGLRGTGGDILFRSSSLSLMRKLSKSGLGYRWGSTETQPEQAYPHRAAGVTKAPPAFQAARRHAIPPRGAVRAVRGGFVNPFLAFLCQDFGEDDNGRVRYRLPAGFI
jgi:hypothetical protein